jgi:predicted RNase H-like nuclease (RuvC/YqgF family)
MLTLALASVTSAKAQSDSAISQKTKNASAQNDDLLKVCDKALLEVEHLRTVRKLSTEQIDALNQKVNALEDLLKLERNRAEAYKSADAERSKANEIDSRRVATLEKVIEDYKAERGRLIGERDRARRNNKLHAIGGAIIGGLLAWFVRGN